MCIPMWIYLYIYKYKHLKVWPRDWQLAEDRHDGHSVELHPWIPPPWQARGISPLYLFTIFMKYIDISIILKLGVVNLPRGRAEERWEAGFCDEHFVQLGRNIPHCRAHWFLWQAGLVGCWRLNLWMMMVVVWSANAWVNFAVCKIYYLEFLPCCD